MTTRQEHNLHIARGLIKNLRMVLDDTMYHIDPLPDNEFKRIREAYDLICKANDKI